MPKLRYVIADVFTDRPLTGNALAVFTDARVLDNETMQAIARETNLSVTAFVMPAQRGGHARLRFFTPTRELPFAGHPTLGAAFVLGGPLETNELKLEVGTSSVTVSLEREAGRLSFGWMTPPQVDVEPYEEAGPVMEALGIEAPELPLALYDNGPRHVCVGLESRKAVGQLSPNFAALARVADFGVSVFHYDGKACKARYFAPHLGVPEDAATGSVAAPLTLHLQRHGKLSESQVLEIEQGAEVGRPSILYTRTKKTGDEASIEVGGSARLVGRGTLEF